MLATTSEGTGLTTVAQRTAPLSSLSSRDPARMLRGLGPALLERFTSGDEQIVLPSVDLPGEGPAHGGPRWKASECRKWLVEVLAQQLLG